MEEGTELTGTGGQILEREREREEEERNKEGLKVGQNIQPFLLLSFVCLIDNFSYPRGFQLDGWGKAVQEKRTAHAEQSTLWLRAILWWKISPLYLYFRHSSQVSLFPSRLEFVESRHCIALLPFCHSGQIDLPR